MKKGESDKQRNNKTRKSFAALNKGQGEQIKYRAKFKKSEMETQVSP
jgi:hypothetical protein